MPRIDEVLGDKTQVPGDATRGAAGFSRATTSQQSPQVQDRHKPQRRAALHRPCCKTCKGESCTGHCKF